MGWGGTELSVPIRFLCSALRSGHVLPSIFHVPVIPVCFGEYPKVLENPISVSQINWGGDLEAGRGRAVLSIWAHYGRSAWGQGKYLRLKKGFLGSKL